MKKTNPFYLSKEWRKIRKEVLVRDHYECVWCRKRGEVTTLASATLEVDHIKELKDYPELALDKDNLRTLCKKCHNERHGRIIFEKQKKKKFDDEIFHW
ncbi:HNH endonuclease [Pilibacter termitis]|uniref:Putative HNH nuclease YajD n=1 Tax=Pilibacter termitis TaxID=263852 RepID=A0A1T4PDF8_9ENTE|nr:HNH endonuclease signature motif containing protein [Pilibacter termitis]SJZ89574.1 HNH endonuclease [Pilibacter termitis]